MSGHPYAIVFMTASNREEAEKIADALVGEGLAACVNMIDACKRRLSVEG